MHDGSGLIDPVNLPQVNLASSLEGLRIAHLSDLHIVRRRKRHDRIKALLGNLRADLVVFTGDYISRPHNAGICAEVMKEICEPLRPRLGVFGVFGNHDTPELRELLSKLPVHWLNNQTYWFENLPLRISGFEADCTVMPDSVTTLFALESDNGKSPSGGDDQSARPLHLMLSHFPRYLPVAADMGIDILICGHTHGGQCRLPGGQALVNSSDLPLRLTSGILRHRDTIAVISRGLGEVRVPLRLFCPPHLPIYTLRSGSLPGQHTDLIQIVERW